MIIAVDPGVNGAIAWTRPDGHTTVTKMPETRGDTIDVFKQIQSLHTIAGSEAPLVCFHEKVANYVEAGGASQMMQFGRMAERCACIAETLGIPVIEIAPKAWQKLLGLGASERKRAPKGATPEERKAIQAANSKAKRDWKNKLKAEAQRRYPDLKVTLVNADALLILAAAAHVPEGAQR